MYRLDTLSALKQASLFRLCDWSQATLPEAVAALNSFMGSSPGLVNPEDEAFRFYLFNDFFAKIEQGFDADEPLPPAALALGQDYIASSRTAAVRLLYYTLLIVTREARHVQGDIHFFHNLKKVFGSPFVTFLQSLKGQSSMAAVTVLYQHPAAMPLGAYTDGLIQVFSNGSFSGGYGGKPWAKIASTLNDFVQGHLSPELFLDTAYTLAHNNGPMFNKGMLYHEYGSEFYKILDVQRSGQMVELVLEGFPHGQPHLQDTVDAWALFPKAWGTYVDWFKVEALGALKKYPKEKQHQTQKGLSSSVNGTLIEIMPNQYAVSVPRQEAA